jgi:hypothetical protein
VDSQFDVQRIGDGHDISIAGVKMGHDRNTQVFIEGGACDHFLRPPGHHRGQIAAEHGFQCSSAYHTFA